MQTLLAKPVSYDHVKKRNRDDIKYIVIHYTGNVGDTAENNAKYFANGNTRQAGAHFFIDRKGNVFKSINLNRTAWSVGGAKYDDCSKTGGGKYYGKCTNQNSVSIELCDAATKFPSKTQIKAVAKTIKYIRRHCANAKTIIRHFDVTGKKCPITLLSQDDWDAFLKELSV